jgi:LPXTG-motif cell wall-anchored protein
MENSKQKPSNQVVNKWQVASLGFELGFIIALPLVGFGFLGKWLDQKFATDPWITLAGILFAILSTTIWLTRRFKKLIR